MLGTLFSVAAGQGAILVSSDAPVAVSTRVAARRPEGDYAAFAPALDGAEAIPDGGTAAAIGVPQTATRRTHLLLFNRGASGNVTVVGYDGAGNQIGSLAVTVPAGAAVRVNSVLAQMGVSDQSVGRIKQKVGELLERRNGAPWEEVCQKLNQKLQGWRQYFHCGSKGRAHKAVDEYVYDRVRNFLRRRHKVSSQGTRQFPGERVYGSLGVLRLQGPRAART